MYTICLNSYRNSQRPSAVCGLRVKEVTIPNFLDGKKIRGGGYTGGGALMVLYGTCTCVPPGHPVDIIVSCHHADVLITLRGIPRDSFSTHCLSARWKRARNTAVLCNYL